MAPGDGRLGPEDIERRRNQPSTSAMDLVDREAFHAWRQSGAGVGGNSGGTIVVKGQRCGRDDCRFATGDPEDLHGPYRWEVTTDPVTGKRKWETLDRPTMSD